MRGRRVVYSNCASHAVVDVPVGLWELEDRIVTPIDVYASDALLEMMVSFCRGQQSLVVGYCTVDQHRKPGGSMVPGGVQS